MGLLHVEPDSQEMEEKEVLAGLCWFSVPGFCHPLRGCTAPTGQVEPSDHTLPSGPGQRQTALPRGHRPPVGASGDFL